MAARDPDPPHGILSRIAALLIRGPDAELIRGDLDDLQARDLARGITPWQARLRYARNMVASALRVAVVRLRLPDVPRISALDFKLGFRMLVRYPGLTLVGGCAFAFALAVGAGTFEFVTDLVYPRIALDEGDRIVELRNIDTTTREPERRTLHDFGVWKAELGSVVDIGAFRELDRNLTDEEGRLEPVLGVEMTAAAFRVARVKPLLGRTLQEADEQPSAASIVIIGFGLWQNRFGADPEVVGQTVRLGNTAATVVGVMPEGFAFPYFHELWAPLRLNPLDYARSAGPEIRVFGRLADGVTFAEANAELSTIGRRAALDSPETHERLRPDVRFFAVSEFDVSGISLSGFYSTSALFLAMFVVVVCANVALLLFARTATRESELVLRNALGASRGRIVTQLFAEAVVLGAVALVAGLGAATIGHRWAIGVLAQDGMRLPFWFSDSLSPTTVWYAVGLTVLGACVAGVVPALKATGKGARGGPGRATGSTSGLRMGGLWTGVIVTQVALTVFFVPFVIILGIQMAQIGATELGFPAEEFLSVRVEMDPKSRLGEGAESRGDFLARFGESYRELQRQVAAEPGVAGVAFALQLPGTYYRRGWIEVEGVAPPLAELGHRAQMGTVDTDFFDVLEAPVLAGRGFDAADLESGARVVVVNESFVDGILGGGNPVGLRLRYLNPTDRGSLPSGDQPPGSWYEIVGVVQQLAMTIDPDLPLGHGLYHPMAAGSEHPVRMAVHMKAGLAAFAPRLRELAADIDPALRVYEPRPLDGVAADAMLAYEAWFRVLIIGGVIALLLSNGGIYSVMSFTVSRRTREIGIRVALGADRHRVIGAIFSRAITQVGLGVLVGVGLFVVFLLQVLGSTITPSVTGAAVVLLYMAVMAGVCTIACIVPMRRALGVEPTEALRGDG